MRAWSGSPSVRQCTVSRMMSGGSAGLRMMIALPRLAPPTFSIAARRGARELVDVLAGAGPGRARGHGRHDLGVRDRLHAAHRGHDRDRRLAAAADHVDVHLALADVLGEVDRRHAVRADRRRREVDHHARRARRACGRSRGARRRWWRRRRCGCRRAQGAAAGRRRPRRSSTVPCSRALARPSEAGSMPTIHTGCEPAAAQRLVHEVGADVARADEGGFDLFHVPVCLPGGSGACGFALDEEFLHVFADVQCPEGGADDGRIIGDVGAGGIDVEPVAHDGLSM